MDHSRDWPFVSLSFFQQRSLTAKEASGILQVSIAPLVTQENRQAYEEYIVSDEAEVDWIEKSIDYQKEVGFAQFVRNYGEDFRNSTARKIHKLNQETGELVEVPDSSQPRYLPVWEMSPLLRFEDVNVDMMQEGDPRGIYGDLCLREGGIVMGGMDCQEPGGISSTNPATSTYAQILSIAAKETVEYLGDPS